MEIGSDTVFVCCQGASVVGSPNAPLFTSPLSFQLISGQMWLFCVFFVGDPPREGLASGGGGQNPSHVGSIEDRGCEGRSLVLLLALATTVTANFIVGEYVS